MASPAQMIQALRAAARALEDPQPARRIALLRRITRSALERADAASLLALHETLLFLAAFPGSADEHREVERELRSLAQVLSQRCERDPRSRRRLLDSGAPGATVSLTPSLTLLRWLAGRWPDDIEIAWRDDSPGDGFEQIVDALAAPGEYDGLVDPRLTMRQWLKAGRGKLSEAQWMALHVQRLFDSAALPPHLCDVVFERMEMEARWRLRDAKASRTFCRFPPRPLHVPTRGAERPPALDQVVAAPLPPPARVPIARAKVLIDIARSALACRGRETDPITYANPREVLLYRLERGIDVLIIGLQPDRRLPLEGFVGYLAARNRVPVAYGGGWIFLDQCTMGINIFDTFRGGESVHLFAQIIRVYRCLFGASVFSVDPYQFGQDNEEAIRSGAFWFYWRMGFRPAEPELLALAEREAQKIAADRAHRSSRQTLRRLATGPMRRSFDRERGSDGTSAEASAGPFIDLGTISLALTKWIAQRHGGDRAAARQRSLADLSRFLDMKQRSLEAAGGWIELLAMIPHLATWPHADRRQLELMLKAKGGPSEIDYLRRLRRHRRLRKALCEIARATR